MAATSSRALTGVPYSLLVQPDCVLRVSNGFNIPSRRDCPSLREVSPGFALTLVETVFSVRDHCINRMKSREDVRIHFYFHRVPLRHHPLTDVSDNIKCKRVTKLKKNVVFYTTYLKIFYVKLIFQERTAHFCRGQINVSNMAGTFTGALTTLVKL